MSLSAWYSIKRGPSTTWHMFWNQVFILRTHVNARIFRYTFSITFVCVFLAYGVVKHHFFSNDTSFNYPVWSYLRVSFSWPIATACNGRAFSLQHWPDHHLRYTSLYWYKSNRQVLFSSIKILDVIGRSFTKQFRNANTWYTSRHTKSNSFSFVWDHSILSPRCRVLNHHAVKSRNAAKDSKDVKASCVWPLCSQLRTMQQWRHLLLLLKTS
jgi:hypothetical protein